MEFSPLATACGLFCGFCRFYMNEECRGCGSADRAECNLFLCCREQKGLQFCTECDEFPCDPLKRSTGLHPAWLEELARLPGKVWRDEGGVGEVGAGDG